MIVQEILSDVCAPHMVNIDFDRFLMYTYTS